MEYLSVKLTAGELGLRYGQVIRLIRKGKLKAEKPVGGWGWMIKRSVVEAYKCKKQ